MKLGKISFGVSAVVAGQKSSTVNAAPQLVANSTKGKFTITSPVSKALGIAPGENMMFMNNISGIETEIAKRNPDLMAYAEEKGWDLDTREGQEACIKEFTQWYIAKGQPIYDNKGQAVTAKAAMTKEEKQALIDEHAMDIVAANREELLKRSGKDEATDEELVEFITVDDIESPTYHVNSGSKCSTTGKATGVGCQLGCTDRSIWTQLKSDLGDNMEKKNRVYTVELGEGENQEFFNGNDTVTVVAYPITFVEDTDPLRVGA